MTLNNLHEKIVLYETIKKDYFTIDLDSLNPVKLLKIYAHVIAHHFDMHLIDDEILFHDIVKVEKSASGKGFHINVYIENNLMENLYYRTIYGDDVHRICHDIMRLNAPNISYDVAFDVKYKFGQVFRKTHQKINVLKYVDMPKDEFFIYIASIKNNDLARQKEIIDKYSKKYIDTQKQDDNYRKIETIVNRFAKKNQDDSITIEHKEELIKTILHSLD